MSAEMRKRRLRAWTEGGQVCVEIERADHESEIMILTAHEAIAAGVALFQAAAQALEGRDLAP